MVFIKRFLIIILLFSVTNSNLFGMNEKTPEKITGQKRKTPDLIKSVEKISLLNHNYCKNIIAAFNDNNDIETTLNTFKNELKSFFDTFPLDMKIGGKDIKKKKKIFSNFNQARKFYQALFASLCCCLTLHTESEDVHCFFYDSEDKSIYLALETAKTIYVLHFNTFSSTVESQNARKAKTDYKNSDLNKELIVVGIDYIVDAKHNRDNYLIIEEWANNQNGSETIEPVKLIYNSSHIFKTILTDLAKKDAACLKKQLSKMYNVIEPCWRIDLERFYQGLFFGIMHFMGNCKIFGEVTTSTGRADVVIVTEKEIFIIEFKLNKSVKEALKQIQSRDYGTFFKKEIGDDKRNMFAMGINIDTEEDKDKVIVETGIEDYRLQEVSPFKRTKKNNDETEDTASKKLFKEDEKNKE